MLSITELKKGTLIELNSQPYRVLEYSQKVMGRGGSIVNCRLKNLVDGSVMTKTFKGNEKIEEAQISVYPIQFLYSSGNIFHFMDTKTYEQFELSASVVAEQKSYMTEGATVSALIFGKNIIAIELPIKLELAIIEADPTIKGSTASAVTKWATLETGAKIQVPAFIKAGDLIVVDTRDNSYVERTK